MSTDWRHITFAFYFALPTVAVAEPVVSVVVGDLLPEEGGPAKAERSPLTSPFGIDFDSKGNMVIVELEGGQVHRRDAAGNLIATLCIPLKVALLAGPPSPV